jgi:hypothetical protein
VREQVLDLVAGQLDQSGWRRIAGLERHLQAVTRMGLRLLEHSLEDQNVAGAIVIGEIDVEAHPDEPPTFVRERVEVLKEHSRVESRIEPSQVPDVNSVLNRLHRSSLRQALSPLNYGSKRRHVPQSTTSWPAFVLVLQP